MKRKYDGLKVYKIPLSQSEVIMTKQSGCWCYVAWRDVDPYNGICDGAEDGTGNYMEEWVEPRE